MKEYTFNENGVCTNCDEEVLYRHNRDYVILCTAKKDSLWVYGWKIDLFEQSAGGEWIPCFLPLEGRYADADKEKLRIHATEEITGRLKKCYPESVSAIRALSQLNPEQMNLF